MQRLFIFLVLLSAIWLFTQCSAPPASDQDANPPAPAFNLAGSDEKAIFLADQVMEASGGRKNWDNTRFLSWVFAGRRKHYWDKWSGNIRIESATDSTTYLLNINTGKGRVKIGEQELNDPALLDSLLSQGKSIWINDSYWLVMPFKMKDDGVTLTYLEEKTTGDGRPADFVAMSFAEVGDTPENVYHVAIDKETKLVSEWAFFQNAAQDTARFVMPWKDYQQYGNILLSGNRERLQLTEISVAEHLPDSIFTAF